MRVGIPYRAAGTFAGPSYVEREADRLLFAVIQQNRRYPYIVAPRQSGKSSLLVRTRGALDPSAYTSAFVDLSTFSLADYDGFWRSFLEEIAANAKLDMAAVNPRRPEDTFRAWLDSFPGRLAVFVDEIDTLIGATFCDQFFSKLRSLFNKRAEEPKLERLMIVLSGAAHPAQLIKDHMRSPFNVGIEIKLDDLTLERAKELVSYLGSGGAKVAKGVAERVHAVTGGSVYLGQLLLERLWARGEERGAIGSSDVDAALDAIVEGAGSEVHFRNIYQLIANNARLVFSLGDLRAGRPIEERSAQDLRLAGISDGATPFRNEVYLRVFGEGGPLDLVKLVREPELAVSAPAPAMASGSAPSDAPLSPLVAPVVTPVVFPLSRNTSRPPSSPGVPTPEQLVSALDQTRERREALRRTGLPTEGVDAELLTLRQRLREGGQLRAGDSLDADRYRLLEQIGRGGVASVWKARDQQTGVEVALKILHPTLASDPARRERFLRGASAMMKLDHPAIVRILQPHGEEEGWLYFAMEFVAGGSLRRAVLDGRVSADDIPRLVLRVGDALAYAAGRGIVHQDVKPASILLNEEGEPKLTDFSLALAALEETESQTRTGAIESFLYAPPEALNHPEDADARADVYGLGMTVIFCYYGADLPAQVVRDVTPVLSGLPCSDAIKRVLRQAVRWDQGERFKDAAAFSAALLRALGDDARQTKHSALAGPLMKKERAQGERLEPAEPAPMKVLVTALSAPSRQAKLALAGVAALVLAVVALLAMLGWLKR